MRVADDALPVKHVAVYGATGSGKTLFVKHLLREMPAPKGGIWAWDPDNSHGFEHVAHDAAGWLGLVMAGKGGAFAPRRVTPALFEFWCRSIWLRGSADKPLVAVVEELGQVTRPGKAPAAWHEVVTRGRKYGIQLVVIAQRPQEADKTILSNKALLVSGYLDRRADRELLAREFDADESDVADLEKLNQKSPLYRYLLVRGAGQPPHCMFVHVKKNLPPGRHDLVSRLIRPKKAD